MDKQQIKYLLEFDETLNKVCQLLSTDRAQVIAELDKRLMFVKFGRDLATEAMRRAKESPAAVSGKPWRKTHASGTMAIQMDRILQRELAKGPRTLKSLFAKVAPYLKDSKKPMGYLSAYVSTNKKYTRVKHGVYGLAPGAEKSKPPSKPKKAKQTLVEPAVATPTSTEASASTLLTPYVY